MQEIEELEAEFRAITKQSHIAGADLDKLNNIKDKLTRVVETEDEDSDVQISAVGLVMEVIDFKISLVVSEAPERLERLRQDQLTRLQGRIDRREHRDDLNKGRNTSKLFT